MSDSPPDRDAVVGRLRDLVASPPLTIGVTGGGVPEPLSLSPEYVVVVARSDLTDALTLLTAPTEDKNE